MPEVTLDQLSTADFLSLHAPGGSCSPALEAGFNRLKTLLQHVQSTASGGQLGDIEAAIFETESLLRIASRDKVSRINWCGLGDEIHVHLGGTHDLIAAHRMAQSQGWRFARDVGVEAFAERIGVRFGDAVGLDEFLRALDQVEEIQSGKENLVRSIRDVLSDLIESSGSLDGKPFSPRFSRPERILPVPSNIELRFCPLKRCEGERIAHGAILRAASLEMVEIERETIRRGHHVRLGMIVCFARDYSHELNLRMADGIADQVDQGASKIVGVDLAGPESATAFDNTAELSNLRKCLDRIPTHLGITLHCGETLKTTYEQFVTMLNVHDRVRRIGHGIQAPIAALNRNTRWMKALQAKQRNGGILLEVCFLSNLLSHAVKSPAQFRDALRVLDHWGIPWYPCTDNPAIQGWNRAQELAAMVEGDVVTEEQLRRAASNLKSFLFVNSKRGNIPPPMGSSPGL